MNVDGCISIVLRGVDLSTPDSINRCCNGLAPIIAQEIANALKGPKSKGCSVSGSVTSGPGGTSGSGTVTCTF